MLRKAFRNYFTSQPAPVRFAMLMTASVFLPYFVACAAVIGGAAYILLNRERRNTLAAARYRVLLVPLAAILLIVPLRYANYPGFFTGLGAVLLLVIALYIGSFAAVGLLDRLCALACGMSFVSAAAAFAEKLVDPAPLRPFYFFVLGIFNESNNPQARAVGLSYNANLYAFIIELVVLAAFYRMFSGGRKRFYIPVVAVNAAALFAPDCRSGWAPILAGLLVLFALKGKKKAIAVLGGLTALFFAVVKLIPNLLPRFFHFGKAASERMVVWKISFQDFLRHPVFGHGMIANLQITGNWFVPHAHNLLLDIMQSTGVAGTLLAASYFVFLMAELVNAFRRARRTGNARVKGACGLEFAVLAALLIHGITDIPVIGVHTGLFFVLLIGARPVERLRTLKTKKAPRVRAGV